jgi:hypothetical protein
MRMLVGEMRFPGNLCRDALPQAINRGFVYVERSNDISHGLDFFQELRCYSNLIRI